MEIIRELVGNILILKIIGEIDYYNYLDLKEYLDKELLQGFKLMVLNLSQVKKLDSPALGTIISAADKCRKAGGGISLCDATAHNVRLGIKLLLSTSRTRYFDTEKEALESLELLQQEASMQKDQFS